MRPFAFIIQIFFFQCFRRRFLFFLFLFLRTKIQTKLNCADNIQWKNNRMIVEQTNIQNDQNVCTQCCGVTMNILFTKNKPKWSANVAITLCSCVFSKLYLTHAKHALKRPHSKKFGARNFQFFPLEYRDSWIMRLKTFNIFRKNNEIFSCSSFDLA